MIVCMRVFVFWIGVGVVVVGGGVYGFVVVGGVLFVMGVFM